ncbi:uncharacterized protein LOC114310016 isoform X4 [Camellia sinensis]|uniref:uncharacterized protein LOC114310016 isoform X4 n=1 Tax=Camellia sinensis TaxID=4442 RepID=UPI0010365EDB|nr:uncharacterized protein LOC114310016 isoform X4 [Camellia sinensis]
MEESHEHDHECDHQPPPSPGVSPDQLKDCIQELLKFTLNGTLVGLDIGLSKDYCSNLLKDDPVSPNPNNTSHTTDGVKTVEGRCAVGDYNRIVSGALILLNKCLVLQVQDVCRYASFSEMLEAESLTKVLPGVKAIEEGVEIYRKFYSEEKERSNGVLAICVTKPAAQPCISLASILSGLSYGGLQRLLGFVHTVGTTVEALPPPRSTLLSSFLLPHNPNVESSTLTDGARALAKHVNRSSSKCWGTYGGSDSNKNKLAKDAISHLIAHCCWQNLHIVPPHGVVYEIRIADGYGARWSEDGTKFIGFLEPYMEDGHSKGWKH